MLEALEKFYIGCMVAIWGAIGFYMFRVVYLRKPQVNMWRDTFWNPFNLILVSSKLTKPGLKARRKLIALTLIFILMALIPLVFGNSIK